jgi:hypothetical protein
VCELLVIPVLNCNGIHAYRNELISVLAEQYLKDFTVNATLVYTAVLRVVITLLI